jgi:hypothetical protein
MVEEAGMRLSAISCAVLLISGFSMVQANGQVTVMGGYASTWVAPPGAYAVPLLPLVVTPSIEFAPPTLEVGASTATAGNRAGATASDLTVETPSPYSRIIPLLAPGITFSSQTRDEGSGTAQSQNGSLDLGAATFQSDYGVAQLARNLGPHPHAAKTYTNDDLNRLRENNNGNDGEVKSDNKTEPRN